MIIREEPQNLNKSFPFSVNEIHITKKMSRRDIYHWHDCLEITCIKKGKGSYYVNGREYKMRAGDIIIFNNVEPHAWDVEDDDGMLALVAIFSTTLISEGASLFDYEYLRPFVERGPNFKNRLPYNEEMTGRIFALIENAYEEYHSRSDGYNLMIKAIVLQVLTLLIRFYQDQEKPRDQVEKRKDDMERIECALDYIRYNYGEPLSLENIAKTANMSPSYFSAFFKRATGETFVGYVCRYRVYTAHRLIRDTKESIAQIASDCGFSSLSNFYRSYRRVFGENPLKSRKKGVTD